MSYSLWGTYFCYVPTMFVLLIKAICVRAKTFNIKLMFETVKGILLCNSKDPFERFINNKKS